jgi:hypothetical protein
MFSPPRNATWASFGTPVLMSLVLVAGIILAAGHHVFYESLHGSEAPTGSYIIAGRDVSKQTFNSAVGTGFAFLVNASLAIAIWMAYTQLFWKAVRNSATGERLSSVDTLFSVSSNVLELARVHIWIRHPLMLALAVIAWSVR